MASSEKMFWLQQLKKLRDKADKDALAQEKEPPSEKALLDLATLQGTRATRH